MYVFTYECIYLFTGIYVCVFIFMNMYVLCLNNCVYVLFNYINLSILLIPVSIYNYTVV